MSYADLPRPVQYGIVFVGAGLIAVAIKAASELDQNRLAGIISMVPMKIVVAWAIVGAASGSRGIAQSTNGMFLGLIALVASMLFVRVFAERFGSATLIFSALGVWLVVASATEWTARRLTEPV